MAITPSQLQMELEQLIIKAARARVAELHDQVRDMDPEAMLHFTMLKSEHGKARISARLNQAQIDGLI